MEIQNYARMQEDKLADEISGLDEQLAKLSERNNSDGRCVAAYLKQLVKRKRNRLATLQYRRGTPAR